MRVIQERTTVPTVSYTRGSDLSGSLEGAGGIGGLLARSHGCASSNGVSLRAKPPTDLRVKTTHL
jgi:hypothetical protein